LKKNYIIMIVTFVNVWVTPDHISEFIAATTENHKSSIKEPGNLRFDVLQDTNDPAKFVIYEAYESDAAAAAHKDTDHHKRWRDTVAGWMAQPRKGEKHIILAPTDASLW
jgi:autoinducer 2-degrading protein